MGEKMMILFMCSILVTYILLITILSISFVVELSTNEESKIEILESVRVEGFVRLAVMITTQILAYPIIQILEEISNNEK